MIVEAPEAHTHERIALQVLRLLHEVEEELIGREVRLVSGEVGIISEIVLDSVHGLAFTIDPIMPKLGDQQPQRYYPISTIKSV